MTENLGPQPDTQPNVHEAVLRWFPPGVPARVLDAGAGEGALSLSLSQRGYRVVACDRTRSRFRPQGIRFVQADLHHALPFAAESFDAVVSTEVLEHLENPHHAVREFSRILRPQGTLVVTTPNILHVYSRMHFLLLGTCDYFDTLSGSSETAFHGNKGHINPVGFPELRYALEQTGLEVHEVVTNRDIRGAIRNGTVRMAFVRRLLWPTALVIRAVTRLARRADPIALRLLDVPLLFGEDLIVRAQRRACHKGDEA
jgi:SAM-dependent methyltransferase